MTYKPLVVTNFRKPFCGFLTSHFILLTSYFCLLPSFLAAQTIQQPNPFLEAGDPIEIVKRELEFLRTGDFPRAYYTNTSKGFRATTSYDAFVQFARRFPSLSRNQAAQFQNPAFYENRIAVVESLLTGTDGVTHRVKFDLILENNRWKLLGIQVYPTPTEG